MQIFAMKNCASRGMTVVKRSFLAIVSIIIFVLGMTPFLFILIIAVIDIFITLIGNSIFLRPLMHDEDAIVVRMDCYLHNTRV